VKVEIGPSWELQNVVRTPAGLRTRKSFASLATPTAGTAFVASFTVESPSTTEPWHYLVEQSTTTLACTLRVFTEEFVELFSFGLGALQDPVITWAMVNNQLMVSAPAFSATLFGMPGGGLISAVKTLSQDPTIVTLDVPHGHICSFGSQVAVAVGPIVMLNQARSDLDPRTFVAEGVLQSFPGTVYDLFQGVDGQLYIFTSAGVFTVPADALGVGQNPRGFISRVPGIATSRPRNAVATNDGVVVLQRDSLLVLAGGSQRQIGLPSYRGPRTSLSRVVDVGDLRLFGELHATPTDCIVGFRGRRGFYIDVDLHTGGVSYVYNGNIPDNANLNVVGTLRTRDGEGLIVTSSRVLAPWITGQRDHDGAVVHAAACGRIELVGDAPVVRRVTVAADNAGSVVGASASGVSDTDTTPTKTGDIVIGTSEWSATGTMVSRSTRTTRLTANKRATEPHVEVYVEGGDRRIGSTVDVELGGTARGKRDKQA
jgi:hypothetical protein